MRSARSFSAAFILFLFLPLLAQAATADQQPAPIDTSRLVSLYSSYVKKAQVDTYLNKRIAEERARIRSLIDEEIQTYITQNSDTQALSTNLTKTIDRQRTLVASLESQLKERTVDLSLITDEQSAYTPDGQLSSSAVSVDPSAVQSYPELLAERAVIEERIASLDAVIQVQQDKLQLLNREQLLEQYAFLITIASYLLILLVVIAVERLIQRLLIARIQKRSRRYFIKKIVSTIIYTLAALWILSRLLSEYPGVLASLAIIGAGLAVALQDVVKDVVAWFLILQKRTFTLGNRITVGDVTGDVIDIGVLRTSLQEVGVKGQSDVLERTGRTLFIPNSFVLTQCVLNAHTSSDFMKAEMQLTITYESDWQKAEKILQDIVIKETKEHTHLARRQHSKRTSLYYVSDEPADALVYSELVSSGIQFTLRFHVPVGMKREVVTDITKQILIRFQKEPTINLAYTTTRSFSTMVSAPQGWQEGRA